MASLINVLDLYNSVAVVTGFPLYQTAMDAPDTTRYLLEMINEGLRNVIENLYMNTNTLERTDELITIPGEQEYGVQGIIKYVEIFDEYNNARRVQYGDNINHLATTDPNEKKEMPRYYTIHKGYMKLYPIPDKAYKIKVVLSSDDVVLADDDTYKKQVDDINDVIIGSQDFFNVIKLRAAALIFIRCNNSLSQVYSNLAQSALKNYIEKDYGSNEAQRGWTRRAGHYDPRRGLLG